jgi:hypothetical protein
LRSIAVILERADSHCGAREIVGRDVAAMDRDGAAGRALGEPNKLVSRHFREYLYIRSCRRQQLRFPRRLRIAARHHGALTFQGNEYRQSGQRVHARWVKLGREAGRSHRSFSILQMWCEAARPSIGAISEPLCARRRALR